jgi:hypothetical protein
MGLWVPSAMSMPVSAVKLLHLAAPVSRPARPLANPPVISPRAMLPASWPAASNAAPPADRMPPDRARTPALRRSPVRRRLGAIVKTCGWEILIWPLLRRCRGGVAGWSVGKVSRFEIVEPAPVPHSEPGRVVPQRVTFTLPVVQ